MGVIYAYISRTIIIIPVVINWNNCSKKGRRLQTVTQSVQFFERIIGSLITTDKKGVHCYNTKWAQDKSICNVPSSDEKEGEKIDRKPFKDEFFWQPVFVAESRCIMDLNKWMYVFVCAESKAHRRGLSSCECYEMPFSHKRRRILSNVTYCKLRKKVQIALAALNSWPEILEIGAEESRHPCCVLYTISLQPSIHPLLLSLRPWKEIKLKRSLLI